MRKSLINQAHVSRGVRGLTIGLSLYFYLYVCTLQYRFKSVTPGTGQGLDWDRSRNAMAMPSYQLAFSGPFRCIPGIVAELVAGKTDKMNNFSFSYLSLLLFPTTSLVFRHIHIT